MDRISIYEDNQDVFGVFFDQLWDHIARYNRNVLSYRGFWCGEDTFIDIYHGETVVFRIYFGAVLMKIWNPTFCYAKCNTQCYKSPICEEQGCCDYNASNECQCDCHTRRLGVILERGAAYEVSSWEEVCCFFSELRNSQKHVIILLKNNMLPPDLCKLLLTFY